MNDAIPPEALLADLPAPIRRSAERLRRLVRRAVPDAIEAVRPGWHLIGYDVPVGSRRRYFGYIAPEPIHVHLGFEHGILMADPDGVLRGAHLKLRKVRYLTFAPDIDIDDDVIVDFIQAAAHIARLPPAARAGLASGALELVDRWRCAAQGGAAWGALGANLEIAAGERTTDELIAGVGRGVLVTDFWYTRVLDPRTQVVTGLTRNGVWLIEDGRIVRPVTNLRFTQSFLDALGPGAVRGISRERAIILGGWDSIFLVPTLHLGSWNFTGGAKG